MRDTLRDADSLDWSICSASLFLTIWSNSFRFGGWGMARSAVTTTQLIDDDRVRVTRFDFAPGGETGWHRHAMDYVITAISPCDMVLQEPGGATRQVHVVAGDAYRRASGVEHNVIDGADTAMSFVEIELK